MDNQTRNILSNISSEDLIREILIRDKEHITNKIQAYWQLTPPEQANEGDIYINPEMPIDVLVFVDGKWSQQLQSTIVFSSFELKKSLTKVQTELNVEE